MGRSRVPALKSINSRHREIIMRMVYQGQSKKDIAEDMDLAYQSLIIVTNTALFKAEVEKEQLKKDLAIRNSSIQKQANEALAISGQVLSNGKVVFPDGRVQTIGQMELMHTVRDILDRAGHMPVERTFTATADLTSIIEEAWRETDNSEELLPEEELPCPTSEDRPGDVWNDVIDIEPVKEGETAAANPSAGDGSLVHGKQE